jgi:hypothetical protein
MASLFDEADAIAPRMRARAGFSEADLAPMFSALTRISRPEHAVRLML